MSEQVPSFIPDRLEEIASVNADAVVQIVEVFLETGRERVEEILQALTAGDWTAVNERAHSLKGSSASVGLVALAGIAGALEMHAAGGSPTMTPEVEALRDTLHPEFERARVGIEGFVESLKS